MTTRRSYEVFEEFYTVEGALTLDEAEEAAKLTAYERRPEADVYALQSRKLGGGRVEVRIRSEVEV